MSEQTDWVEALNINPEELNDWSSQAQEGVPLLIWCLQNEKIPWKDYAAWASSQYHLPILDNEFFQTHFDLTLLASAQKSESWNEWCFPVAKWDDVTIVACAVPPTPPPQEPGPVTFVLTDPLKMKEIWHSSEFHTIAPEDAPVGISLEAKPFHLDLGDEMPSEPATPPAPAPAATAPTPKPTPTAAAPATSPVAEAPSNAEPIDQAFRQIKAHYRDVVVLGVEDSHLKLRHWDDDLHPTDTKITIDLDQPSLFRIAAKTQLPYHGYVVDTPIHRSFFKAFGLDTLPECVTAVPIKKDDELTGLLVAWGEERAQAPDCLQLAEKVASKISA